MDRGDCVLVIGWLWRDVDGNIRVKLLGALSAPTLVS